MYLFLLLPRKLNSRRILNYVIQPVSKFKLSSNEITHKLRQQEDPRSCESIKAPKIHDFMFAKSVNIIYVLCSVEIFYGAVSII